MVNIHKLILKAYRLKFKYLFTQNGHIVQGKFTCPSCKNTYPYKWEFLSYQPCDNCLIGKKEGRKQLLRLATRAIRKYDNV